jgi:hypothetical protein
MISLNLITFGENKIVCVSLINATMYMNLIEKRKIQNLKKRT